MKSSLEKDSKNSKSNKELQEKINEVTEKPFKTNSALKKRIERIFR